MFKFLEDVSIADVAFEASGKTLEELFESSALATTSVMIKDLKTIKPKIKKKIKLKSNSLENLLHDFLQELIFLKDARTLVFSKYKIKVNEKSLELTAEILGDKLDPKKQEHLVDVKAVTWHQFKVWKEKNLSCMEIADLY